MSKGLCIPPGPVASAHLTIMTGWRGRAALRTSDHPSPATCGHHVVRTQITSGL